MAQAKGAFAPQAKALEADGWIIARRKKQLWVLVGVAKAQTRNHYRDIFSACLNYAVRQGWAPSNVLAQVKRASNRAERERVLRRDDFYDPDEGQAQQQQRQNVHPSSLAGQEAWTAPPTVVPFVHSSTLHQVTAARRGYACPSRTADADRLSVGMYEGDVDAEPHRACDVGDLAEREVAAARFDGGKIGGRDAEALGERGLGEPERLAGVFELAPENPRVDLGRRGPRHRLRRRWSSGTPRRPARPRLPR